MLSLSCKDSGSCSLSMPRRLLGPQLQWLPDPLIDVHRVNNGLPLSIGRGQDSKSRGVR